MQFLSNFKGKPLVWANFVPSPPPTWGQNSAGPPTQILDPRLVSPPRQKQECWEWQDACFECNFHFLAVVSFLGLVAERGEAQMSSWSASSMSFSLLSWLRGQASLLEWPCRWTLKGALAGFVVSRGVWKHVCICDSSTSKHHKCLDFLSIVLCCPFCNQDARSRALVFVGTLSARGAFWNGTCVKVATFLCTAFYLTIFPVLSRPILGKMVGSVRC